MRTVQLETVIDDSRFNKFHLLVFIWCFFAISFDGFDIALYGIGLPLMTEDFGLSAAQGGALGSYALIGMMAGTFILGSFSDIIGRKRVLALCLFIISLFNMLAGFAPNETVFIIMRFIASMGMGGLMPVVISLMTEYSPKKNRAMIVAVMYCGYSFGAIFASIIGMVLLEALGWRFMYWLGVLPLLSLPFFLKQFPESLSYHLSRNQGDKVADILNRIDPRGDYQATDHFEFASAAKAGRGVPLNKLFSEGRALTTVAFWIMVFSCLMMIYGLNTWLPTIMMESGFGVASSLSFILILAVGQIIGSLAGGYLVDRIGHRNVLLLMYLIGAASFVALSVTQTPLLLYVLIAIGGACTGGTQNLVNPYISTFYPADIRGTGLSMAVGIGRLGSICAPILIGLVLMTSLSPQTAFMAFAIPSLIGFTALLLVQEKQTDKVQKEVVSSVSGSNV
ncbi:MFS transporter [Salinicoccus hispanicus]|uniref:MFS transporter n=1 Tax=Salinicoccus hispanicus TaxID=157225 RepID=A0A6N8U0T8_9STAP|nr:MFS transporter [Salinicoccus hispanicus]MXQ51694.1 MFS transporter [Salinicoccus hispanicus]